MCSSAHKFVLSIGYLSMSFANSTSMKFTCFPFILLSLSLFTSNSVWAQSQIELELKVDVDSVTSPNFSLRGAKEIFFFISPETITTPRPTLDDHVSNSTIRKVHHGSIGDFWLLFLNRATELSIEPGDGFSDVMRTNRPYDTNLDTNLIRRENPIQNYLTDELGLHRVEARDLYRSLQLAYLGGGESAAKLAYHDFFSTRLHSEVVNLMGALTKYRDIRSIELQDQLLGSHKQIDDKVSTVVDRLISGLSDNQLLREIISSAGISLYDKDGVRQFLVDNLDKLTIGREATTSDSFMNIIIMSSPLTRYRDGIQYEKEKNLGSYNGPLFTLSRYNNHMYEIIRIKILLGHSYEAALSYLNFILSNESRVRSALADRDLDWVSREFNGSRRSCKSFLM